MYDQDGTVIYVGKAKNLKKRLASYFRRGDLQLNEKHQRLIAQLFEIKFTITQHENEALILENTLIKAYKPQYNVLLKDNKGYPSLWLSEDPFPSLTIQRGAKPQTGQLFGPYPNSGSIKNTLSLLQKIFHIRQCDNIFFSHRTRPCLQYQIGRCSAPCVGKISQKNYHEAVTNTVLFLQGKSEKLTSMLTQKMQIASTEHAYEEAAMHRDQLAQLRSIQIKQSAMTQQGHIDVIAGTLCNGKLFVEILLIRNGDLLGHQSYQSKVFDQNNLEDALWAFLPQYYLNDHLPKPFPATIYLNAKPLQSTWLAKALSEQWQQPVKIRLARQAQAKRWLQIALTNLHDHVHRTTKQADFWIQRCQSLRGLLALNSLPERIVCFDVSHHAGEATKASCVACGPNGLIKSAYRLFNITQNTPGDDYFAIKEALSKYLQCTDKKPDLIVIDGGKGQLSAAMDVLEKTSNISLPIIGIAKGKERKRGAERLFIGTEKQPMAYEPNDIGILMLLQLRDEAHRFAIKGHRQKKRNKRKRSILENIPGIGTAKRQALLAYFGGLQSLQKASLEQINEVPGIHAILAQRIYAALHGDLPGEYFGNLS